MKVNYLCKSWQFLLQQIVYLVSRGYIYYFVGEIPLDKASKAKKIDKKIVNKYNINLSKDQRARRKKKKLANFYYLRWKNQFVILHTKGKLDIELDDVFFNIKEKQTEINKLKVKVGNTLTVNVIFNVDKPTVVMSNEIFKDAKVVIHEIIKAKQLKRLEAYFRILNSIPAWSGIVKQKKLLHNEVFRAAKKYGLNTKKRQLVKYPCQYKDGLKNYPLWVNTYRKIYGKEYTNANIEEWL